MARKIIAKDIILGNVSRSLQALDEYVKCYNTLEKTENLVNELKCLNVNLNSFRFIKLEPMTVNTLFKTYNYNFDKYKYFIMFPRMWSFFNMCYIQEQNTGSLKLDRHGIRYNISVQSQKEVIDTLRSGNAFLLVTNKKIDVSTWRSDSSYKNKTHIVNTLEAHDRVRVIDRTPSNITVLGHNNKKTQLTSYDITGYSNSGYTLNFIDYLDKSGYSRVHFQMQLENRLKEFNNNKLKEKFTNDSTIKNMCDMIQNYQVAVTVLPTDTTEIVHSVYRYSDYFSDLLSSYNDILRIVRDNRWGNMKEQLQRFNNTKERLDEVLRDINSLRTNVIEQQTCGI